MHFDVQQIALKNPYVCKKLGLPDKDASALAAKEKDNSVGMEMYMSRELREILAQNISPSEMVKVSSYFSVPWFVLFFKIQI